MIPESTIPTDLAVIESIESTKTYSVLNGKIQGYIEQIDALKQAIYKVLGTEKYQCPLYGFSYGIELESLIGKDSDYVRVEIKRRISECLLQDERIQSVDEFSFDQDSDSLLVTFKVKSIYGNLLLAKEVDT